MAAALLALGCASAHAGNCTITTVPVTFGTYDPQALSAPLTTTGSVGVSCILDGNEHANGIFVSIALTRGSGSFGTRTLLNGTSTLNYNLYTTASYGTVWGDGTGGTGVVSGFVGGNKTGQPNPRTFQVFGRIPLNQDPAPGPYTYTLTVTLTF